MCVCAREVDEIAELSFERSVLLNFLKMEPFENRVASLYITSLHFETVIVWRFCFD